MKNRWPQGYLDPVVIRQQGIEGALQVGALVAFWTRTTPATVYIVHASEIAPDEDAVHQTTWDSWLRATAVARTAPIAGLQISLRP